MAAGLLKPRWECQTIADLNRSLAYVNPIEHAEKPLNLWFADPLWESKLSADSQRSCMKTLRSIGVEDFRGWGFGDAYLRVESGA